MGNVKRPEVSGDASRFKRVAQRQTFASWISAALKHRNAAILGFDNRADTAALRGNADRVTDGAQTTDQRIAITRKTA